MEFGVFDHVERSGSDLARTYADRLAVARAAEDAGFYCIHVAEHQGTPLSLAPSPNVLLSAISQCTSRIRFGALCYILPLYDPLRLINEICMLDQLSGGRVQIGVGRGVSPIEMGFFGMDPSSSREIFQEDLEIILQGLTSSNLTYDGKHRRYVEVPIELSPVQVPTPPIWYPTSSVASVPWIAEKRFNTVFLGAPAHVAEQVKVFQDSLADPDDFDRLHVGILRYVFVAETDAEAIRHAGPTYHAHLENLHFLGRTRGVRARAVVPDTAGAREGNPENIAEAVNRGWAAVGSPETVTEQVQKMIAETGCNYLIFNPLLADTAGDRAVAAVQLFGDAVMPRLSAHR
jgi:alkanesulfonate monooxygenase SsuD/methylene tetrahydromethanopterin reductase-like flavin-dependent oxidoreductase (luciferase family)